MGHTILYTGGSLPSADVEKLERRGYRVKIERPDLTDDQLIAALQDVDAYILGGYETASRRIIESAPRLKVIAFYGVGYESYVDATAATEMGVAVTNTPAANAQSVAELTIALALGAARKLIHLVDRTRNGEWMELRGWNLSGKTLGIVGAGSIGTRVARIAHSGFGMNILYSGPRRKPDFEREFQARHVELDELLQASDVVSLHLNWTPERRSFIGAREIGLMKENAILVNTARAALVDPHALREALSESRIGAAAFDGYFQEPVPAPEADEFGLLSMSNELMIVSPHTGWNTEDAIRAMTDLSVDGATAVLERRSTQLVVNPDYVKNAKS